MWFYGEIARLGNMCCCLCVDPWGKPSTYNTKWKKNFDSLTSHSEPDTKKWHLLQIVLGMSRGPALLTEQTLRHKTQLSLQCMDAWKSHTHYLRHFRGNDIISCFITSVCKTFLLSLTNTESAWVWTNYIYVTYQRPDISAQDLTFLNRTLNPPWTIKICNECDI